MVVMTMVADRSRGFPPQLIKDHSVLAKRLRQRQLPGNPWEVYSDKTTVRELLEDTRAWA